MKRAIASFGWVGIWGMWGFTLLVFPATAAAQSGSAAVQREEIKDLLQLRPPQQQPAEAEAEDTIPRKKGYPDVDRDVGRQNILRKQEPHDYFKIFANESTTVPDNAFLTNRNPQSDILYQTQVGASLNPKRPVLKNFQLQLQANWFRYRDFEVQDFNTYRLNLNYFKPFKWNNWQLAAFATVGYERLEFGTSLGRADRGDAFLKQNVLNFGIQRYFSISKWQFFYAGTSARFTASTEVDGGKETQADPERDSLTLFLGYNYQYSRKLALRASYRFRSSRYQFITVPDIHRRDKNHNLSASISYDFTEHLKLNTTYSYAENNSNTPVFEYDVNNIGLGADVSWKF